MKRLFLASILLALLLPAAPALAHEPVSAPPPQWQQLFPPVSPPPRGDHAMAYDTARGVAVLFGGIDSSGNVFDDTWEWDSAPMTWTERQPAHRPQPRHGAALVYDAARDVTVLFGGRDGVNDLSDTWLWDGNDWTQVFPANSPSERWLAGVAYDTQRQVTVLFGGLDSQVPLGDTWESDGTNWTEQLVSGPSLRSGPGMAYDPIRNVTVLFGGSDGQGFLQDTWERAGDGPWEGVIVSRHPSRRTRMGVAYFPRLRRVLLYGGTTFDFYDDTWFWNGQKWVTRAFDPRPPGRCCMAMVYDPVLRGVLLFGGSVSAVAVNDTWIFR